MKLSDYACAYFVNDEPCACVVKMLNAAWLHTTIYCGIMCERKGFLHKTLDKVIIYDILMGNKADKGGDFMSTFSDRLTAMLRKRNMTQKQLAQQTNITESAMSYYVKGARTPSGDILTKIAIALNTSTDYLLGITNDPETVKQGSELHYLQRNLGKLDPERLRKAEALLKMMFDDIFDDEEE